MSPILSNWKSPSVALALALTFCGSIRRDRRRPTARPARPCGGSSGLSRRTYRIPLQSARALVDPGERPNAKSESLVVAGHGPELLQRGDCGFESGQGRVDQFLRTPCAPGIPSSLWFKRTLSTLWASIAFRFRAKAPCTIASAFSRACFSFSRARASAFVAAIASFVALIAVVRSSARFRALCFVAVRLGEFSVQRLSEEAKIAEPAVIASPISTTAAARPATRGLRLHQRQSRSGAPTGRATIGSPSRKLPRSTAIAAASGKRLAGSFWRAFRQIVSRSFGTLG